MRLAVVAESIQQHDQMVVHNILVIVDECIFVRAFHHDFVYYVRSIFIVWYQVLVTWYVFRSDEKMKMTYDKLPSKIIEDE